MPSQPHPNIQYAATGGFRFELEQLRKVHTAIRALNEQMKLRITRPVEDTLRGDLESGMNLLQAEIKCSQQNAQA